MAVTVCSVEWDVTVPGRSRFIGPFHCLILNILILGTAIGERGEVSSKLFLSSEGIHNALSAPAESEGWIIESEENTTLTVGKCIQQRVSEQDYLSPHTQTHIYIYPVTHIKDTV